MKTVGTVLLLVGVVGMVSCAQPARPSGGTTGAGQPARPEREAGPPRTLTMAIRFETVSLAPKATTAQGVNASLRAFSAQLTYIDGQGMTQPYLAESLPRLNTDTWRVLPDGRMEVAYKLRAGLIWHDGKPLTADDFVFAFRVYTTTGIGMFTATPQNLMEAVEARDPQTFVMSWKSLYPEAANLRLGEFDPLPRHILQAPLSRFEEDPESQQDAFRNHPFWTQEFVGAGPFQLERWDPGSQMEGVAFAGHVLGRPKVDRLIIKLMADPNTVLSNMLSENINASTDFSLRYEHAVVLLSNWEASKAGVALLGRGPMNHVIVQFRPDYQKTSGLLDVRVRRAMAHSIDRPTLNEALFDGRGFMTETNVPDDARFYPQLERSITRYSYDPRRTEQLMVEAGFTRDGGGFFASAQAGRFRPEFFVIQDPQYERQQAIMQATWAQAGIDTDPRTMGTVQLRDFESAVTFSGLSTRLHQPFEASMYSMFSSAQIGGPTNRWLGNNRGGWSSPEYDRLFEAFNTTLDRSERDRQAIEMMKVTADQLPVFPIYFNIEVTAHLAKVRGPALGSVDRLHLWNIHEWEIL